MMITYDEYYDLFFKLNDAVDIIDLLTDHTEVPEPLERQIESLKTFINELRGKL